MNINEEFDAAVKAKIPEVKTQLPSMDFGRDLPNPLQPLAIYFAARLAVTQDWINEGRDLTGLDVNRKIHPMDAINAI